MSLIPDEKVDVTEDDPRVTFGKVHVVSFDQFNLDIIRPLFCV